MPRRRSSSAQSTSRVVSRTRGSSSIATWATMYGEGSPGSRNRWLTVKPNRVAKPETSRTRVREPRQCGHTGLGGWTSAEHDSHSCSRSRPSAPEVQ
jgi:hypothetical protein